MLKDIYPRLLSEVIPDELSLNSLDLKRLISEHNASEQSNTAYGQLLKSIYHSAPDSNIGLHFGNYLVPSKLCDFSRVLTTAPNLRTAFELAERTYYLQGACYHPVVSFQNGKASVALIFPYKNNLSESQRRFCAETAFSFLINGIRESISSDFKPLKVTFDYASPDYAEEYKSTFGDAVFFEQALNLIEIDEQYLYQTTIGHNSTMHNMYLNKHLDAVRSNDRHHNFEYKAISYLLLHHPDTLNSKNLAARLNISVRGLQKRLSKTGQSFSGISNQCRRELAKTYLIQQQQSVDYTAEQLGFQTNSGFRRFFKTEFNTSPSDFIEKSLEHELAEIA